MRFNISCDETHGFDDRALTNVDAGQNGAVEPDTNVIANDDLVFIHRALVDGARRMGVGDNEFADLHVAANVQTASIIQQRLPTNNNIISNREIVAEAPLHESGASEVAANFFEDIRRQHLPELQTEMSIQS